MFPQKGHLTPMQNSQNCKHSQTPLMDLCLTTYYLKMSAVHTVRKKCVQILLPLGKTHVSFFCLLGCTSELSLTYICSSFVVLNWLMRPIWELQTLPQSVQEMCDEADKCTLLRDAVFLPSFLCAHCMDCKVLNTISPLCRIMVQEFPRESENVAYLKGGFEYFFGSFPSAPWQSLE